MTWHLHCEQSFASNQIAKPLDPSGKMETLASLSCNESATLETPPHDGKYLLQLIKGGNSKQTVGDRHYVQGQGEECPPWQLHDPAVAEMGPCHPCPVVDDHGSVHMQSRSPYLSHGYRMGSLVHPKNSTPSHAFNPENAFPSAETFFHTAGGGSHPSVFRETVTTSMQSNSVRAFQSRGDRHPFPAFGEGSHSQAVDNCLSSYPCQFNPSVHQNLDFRSHSTVVPFQSPSYSVDMNEQKALNGTQPFHGWKTMVDLPNLELKESPKVNGPEVDASQSQHGIFSHQHFYGNGSELLQLLHGNSDKASGTGARLLGDNQDGVTYSKGVPSTVHGPIGPPRNRNLGSTCPDDILGRIWAATPSSQKSQGLYPELNLKPSFAIQNSNSLDIPLNEAIWNDKGDAIQEKQLDAISSPVETGKVVFSQSNSDEGSIKSFSSKVMPDSVQPYATGDFLHSWESWNDIGGPSQTLERRNVGNLLKNDYKISACHGQFTGDRDDNNFPLISSEDLRMMEPLEKSHKEAKTGLVTKILIEDRTGAGKCPILRGVIRAGASKGSAEELVGEKQKGRIVDADMNVHGLQDEEELQIQIFKPTKLVVSKSEEARRRKWKQKEWRLKQARLGHPLQKIFAKERMEDADSTLAEQEVFSKSENDNPLLPVPLASQVEHPGLPAGCLHDSVSGPSFQEGRQNLEEVMAPFKQDDTERSWLEMEDCEMHEDVLAKEEQDELFEKFADYLDLKDDQEIQDCIPHNKKITSRQTMKNLEVPATRAISRQPCLPKQHSLMTPTKKCLRRRADLERFTVQLLAIFRSLIPSEEEETRRRQCLSQLDDVVCNKWPGAKLFLFGSCANAFGVCNSDIDVCLSVEDNQMSTAELVVRMAEILEDANMQRVQALTHARVPIVKFTDPTTDMSCDICVNNMLAVVNSKLLHDYAKIDVRLRQLAFLVKHWAKRRQINETYRGTLSSYAYVLMCIHFLQLRNPPILPCLQGMGHTYYVKVGKIECAYYDEVETLTQFGLPNKDSLGELVTSFFEYWAFQHDYSHVVISVRTGRFLSKDEKAWTRRIGNERHLICIEDPFEVTHDLGRVVDKHSIRVLREEFYRAAKIMRHDSNPSLTLFEPYIRETF